MYDVLVVGAGHAGIEAAMAAARMGQKTLLVSSDFSRSGSMPCNPSVGGPAKGIVVREIDALGGVMPKIADKTALQFKMLNTAKGPGVRCLRVQSDKEEYMRQMHKALQEQPNLDLYEQTVASLLVQDGKATGVSCEDGTLIKSKTVILTSGTYMSACILKGHTSVESGPEGTKTNKSLSQSLKDNGLELIRLKTGTPPRIARDSVDLTQGIIQPGSEEFLSFSDSMKPEDVIDKDKQEPCYLIYTNEKTHQIIRDHLQDSAMYSGLVTGVGPRYCPSIEDKLVRFADKPRHQLFLEPETKDYDTLYIQGFSTSMPEAVQEQMVHSLPGLEHAEILKYAYAIEYDAIDPLQMKPSMENKRIENLFTAGQINGTSGYEEAAGQGLMAGINASLKNQGREPMILRRDQAYIGVMIDDLTTKGTKEPYRLLTSRAEYRLLLRHDNASVRLTELGHEAGVVGEEQWQQYLKMKDEIDEGLKILEETKIKPDQINDHLAEIGADPLAYTIPAVELLKRPKISLKDIDPFINLSISHKARSILETEVKYEGYIKKARKDVERMEKLESLKIPEDMDYDAMDNLALEARSKLSAIRPLTLGQASRISGINPSDIAILAATLRSH